MTIGEAENPIPAFEGYKSNDKEEYEIYINDKAIAKTFVFDDYSKTATESFNQKYDQMVAKNVTSMATKIVTATAAANAAVNNPGANAIKGEAKSRLCGNIPAPGDAICGWIFDKAVDTAAGAATGALAGASIEPDLRSWTLLPANFQAKRIFLEPGEYIVKLKNPGSESGYSEPIKVKIEKDKPFFLNLRSIKI
jgi:hypothetical protein